MSPRSPSAHYRAQHDELAKQTLLLSEAIAENIPTLDASNITKVLFTIAGRLRVHLALEDNALYPRLLKHKDDKIQSSALLFQKEMGHIREAFDKYLKHWTTSTISADPQGFRRETRALLKVLHDRIHRENTQLYPLLDKIGY